MQDDWATVLALFREIKKKKKKKRGRRRFGTVRE